jgi:hypothetical protein
MGGTPNPTAGFEYTLADGSKVKAENVEEAFKTVAKMKEDTATALKEERSRREEMEARLNAIQAEVQQRNQPTPQAGQFDKDRYYRLMGEDPIQANRYLLAHDLGIDDPNQVPVYFQNAQATISKLEQDTLAASFVNMHPDFPKGDIEAAQTLTNEVVRLRSLGHPVSQETLDLAWQNCLSSESIAPTEPPQEREEVNPSPGGAGQGTIDAETSRIEEDVISGKMSTADFEKYLRSKGALGG